MRYGVGGNGGADTVGWVTVTITPEMVGHRIAIFTAIEAKMPGKYATTEQRRFIDAVTAAGGIAGIARSESDALALISQFPRQAPRKAP